MNATPMFERLATQPDALGSIVALASEADTARRPAGGGWTIREVLGHLVSEEVEDFRARVEFVLDAHRTDWPMLDPEARVRDGGFNERTAASLLLEFRRERERSLAWLRSLKEPDWTRSKVHPRMGPMRAGDFFAAWVAHDLLHARQITKILHSFVVEEAAPFETRYAGDW